MTKQDLEPTPTCFQTELALHFTEICYFSGMVQKVSSLIKNIRFDFCKYDLIRSLLSQFLLSCCCLELHVSSPGLSPVDEFQPSENTTEDFSMQGNVEINV